MLAKISKLLHSWARGWLIAGLIAAFAVFVTITLPVLQAAPGGSIESLDAQIFYTPEEAFSTVRSYGDARSYWVRIYLTWDVINPILYSLAFSLTISWLFQRGFEPGRNLQKMNVLPLGAGLFDFLENISIVTMFLAYPRQLTVVAWISTACTMSKMSFLGVSTLLILLGAVRAAMNRFEKQG